MEGVKISVLAGCLSFGLKIPQSTSQSVVVAVVGSGNRQVAHLKFVAVVVVVRRGL
jgi:phosphate/sulfate permease